MPLQAGLVPKIDVLLVALVSSMFTFLIFLFDADDLGRSTHQPCGRGPSVRMQMPVLATTSEKHFSNGLPLLISEESFLEVASAQRFSRRTAVSAFTAAF